VTDADARREADTQDRLDSQHEGTGGAAAGLLLRTGLTTWDAGAVAAAVLLVVAFVPAVFFESWSPRMAIVFAVGPVGLVLLSRLCIRSDRAALALAAALFWTVLSALLGPATRSALFGYVGRDLSALTIVGSAAFWPLGTVVSARGRRVLVEAVVWASGAGAVVGIAQALSGVDTGPLAMLGGRPTGFATNPVFFGAVSASGLAASVTLAARERSYRFLVAIVLLGVAVSMSGSRAAMIGSVVVLVSFAVTSRSKPAALSAGVGAASLFAGVFVDRWLGAGRNAADRLIEAGSGTDGRSAVWRYGIEAFTDRPFTGYGFGRFRPAVQGRFTPSFVRDYAPDDVTQAWFDAHNIGVGLLVAVGAIGVVLFIAWTVLALRMQHGWVAWAVVPLAVHWCLQPVSLYTLPLAMLLFGVARGLPNAPEQLIRRSRAVVAAVVLGLIAGGTLLTVDLLFQQAADDLDVDRLETLANFFGDDPIVADVIAQAHSSSSAAATPTESELDWRRRAVDAEPDRPYWWTLLAEKQFDAADLDAAEVSVARALALQPTNRRAVRVEILLALTDRDEVRLTAALALACELGATDCTLDAETLIAQADEADEAQP